MTREEEARHLARRRRRAQQFIDHPHLFKVCDLCLSVSYADAGICQICGGYCWHTDAATVIKVARVIGSTPFPQTAGVVPRAKKIFPAG